VGGRGSGVRRVLVWWLCVGKLEFYVPKGAWDTACDHQEGQECQRALTDRCVCEKERLGGGWYSFFPSCIGALFSADLVEKGM
jgi:hypothetical protein